MILPAVLIEEKRLKNSVIVERANNACVIAKVNTVHYIGYLGDRRGY